MAEDYTSMTVAELKVLLKEQGLPVSGKKSELIERLSAVDEPMPENDDLESPPVEESVAESDDAEEDIDEVDDDWDDDWEDEEDEGKKILLTSICDSHIYIYTCHEAICNVFDAMKHLV